jgi:phosphopantothenoylcysteine synthetase/decarboxylase
MSKPKEVILGVTASIAAYRACDIINRLKERRINVTCVLTRGAREFITPLTLQTLSANRVIGDLFALPDNIDPVHISLARRAGLVLIAPATADIIAKLACGIADDALTCLCLSTRAPKLICPAMNEAMFKHKITQENIARLKKTGYRFIGPRRGHLVCGDKGIGHLASVSEIVQAVLKRLR